MRVIAGRAKGRVLIAPEGYNTRPITSKIKEALFSIMQIDIPGAKFLDLFAGSGSIGIEALSRGAQRASFVEKDRKAAEIIRKNLENCKFGGEYDLYQDDVFRAIEKFKFRNEKFDIIYLDPPFTVDEIFLPVMEALGDGKILSENGIIVIRTRKEKDLPDKIGQVEKYKFKVYGISAVHFYTQKSQEE